MLSDEGRQADRRLLYRHRPGNPNRRFRVTSPKVYIADLTPRDPTQTRRADRLAESSDPKEQKRLKGELARLTYGE